MPWSQAQAAQRSSLIRQSATPAISGPSRAGSRAAAPTARTPCEGGAKFADHQHRQFISVVLSAPFSPSSATISPRAACNETSSSARVAPNCFEAPVFRGMATRLCRQRRARFHVQALCHRHCGASTGVLHDIQPRGKVRAVNDAIPVHGHVGRVQDLGPVRPRIDQFRRRRRYAGTHLHRAKLVAVSMVIRM